MEYSDTFSKNDIIYDNYQLKLGDSRSSDMFDSALSKMKKHNISGLGIKSKFVTYGIINQNYRFYDPKYGDSNSKSFYKPYGKPIIVEHFNDDNAEAVIGRVITAEYNSTGKSRGNISGVFYTTEYDAMAKFRDQRFLTVSPGHIANHTCSICGNDRFTYCEHKPGLKYDGQLAYRVYGKKQYIHVAVVAEPADPSAIIEEVVDISEGDSVYVGLDDMMGAEYDSLNNSGVPFYTQKAGDGTDSSIYLPLDYYSENIEKDSKTFVIDGGKKSDNPSDKKEDSGQCDGCPEYDGWSPDEAVELGVFESDLIHLLDTEFDKKLTTKQRKNLPDSAFCGPGRSFPVPDCAHVTAALRLLGRSDYSKSTKEKIRACVNRKAKALGCNGSNKDGDSKKPDNDFWEETMAREFNVEETLGRISELSKSLVEKDSIISDQKIKIDELEKTNSELKAETDSLEKRQSSFMDAIGKSYVVLSMMNNDEMTKRRVKDSGGVEKYLDSLTKKSPEVLISYFEDMYGIAEADGIVDKFIESDKINTKAEGDSIDTGQNDTDNGNGVPEDGSDPNTIDGSADEASPKTPSDVDKSKKEGDSFIENPINKAWDSKKDK